LPPAACRFEEKLIIANALEAVKRPRVSQRKLRGMFLRILKDAGFSEKDLEGKKDKAEG